MTLKRMLLWMPLLAGCHLGEVVVNPAARPIQVGFAPPSAICRNMGPVVGATPGGASTTPADVHIERALEDARNKAAALGANYLQTQPPQLKGAQYGVVGAIVMGLAYWCPPETPEALAYATARQQAEAHEAVQKVPPARFDPDDLQIVRKLPEAKCTVLGEELVIEADHSLVHAVNTLRKNAVDLHANTVLLGAFDDKEPTLRVHGQYFSCAR